MRLIEALQKTGRAVRYHKIRKNRPAVLTIIAKGMNVDQIMIAGEHFSPRPLLNAEMGIYIDGTADWEPLE